MQKRYRQLIEKQPKVKVVVHTEDRNTNAVKFSMLAAVLAGIFYFFGDNVWYALLGG